MNSGSMASYRAAAELPDREDDWGDDTFYDDSDSRDDEDDDPYGCCCPGRCLMWDPHHRMSECFTAEDCYNPTRWEEFTFTARNWLRSLLPPAPNHVCDECGLPDRRLWFKVGEHKDCEDIPF